MSTVNQTVFGWHIYNLIESHARQLYYYLLLLGSGAERAIYRRYTFLINLLRIDQLVTQSSYLLSGKKTFTVALTLGNVNNSFLASCFCLP